MGECTVRIYAIILKYILIYAFLDTSNYEENELAHEKWCNDLSAKFLCVFVLDRFGDFVSDQVRATALVLDFPTNPVLRSSPLFERRCPRP